MSSEGNENKPLVLITGAAGKIGSALYRALKDDYRVIRCDRPGAACDVEMDITSADSVKRGIDGIKQHYGERLAGVIHLAAFFDFSGEPSPLYDAVNVQGTKHLLEGLQALKVERFIYAGTMLVHAPAERGELINEDDPLAPRWAYPQSKADAEAIIREHHGHIPYTILRLAGLYDDKTAAPTLSQQIARIYEKDLKSHLYAGDIRAGQAFIHQEDMLSLFRAVLERRGELPEEDVMLAGEPDVLSYDALQDRLGRLIHGAQDWKTFILPESLAKAGAWLEEKAEPVIPDALDRGEKPFIRPFMIDMACDHYALDISRATRALDWQPQHRIEDGLETLVAALKEDPAGWYESNGIRPPDWLESAEAKNKHPETLRRRYEQTYREAHARALWAPFLTIGLGLWLLTSPMSLGYVSQALAISDMICGALAMLTGACSLSSRKWMRLARFDTALIGLWLMFAPLLFWAPTAAAYLNGTLCGTLLFALALLVRPFPAMSPTAATDGPEIPPGWDFSPSSWFQRLPVIALAFVGFFISRYLTAYQLGHIEAVWDPFFPGAIEGDGKNGTEEIITSPVSEAWPVPDAGLGALTYLLEILTGMIGSRARWRTMPWLVLLFGFMIIPLGIISITFIIIQPIMLGTWCTLCLVAAAAMLLQIPYSFDEIVATLDFLRRRAKVDRPWLLILFTGDTDKSERREREEDDFTRPPLAIAREIITGGVSVPWNLALSGLIGLWLLFTRVSLGNRGMMADADHLIGSLVLTATVTALAEVARPLRFLNLFLGAALLITPFVYGAALLSTIASLICGAALIALSFRRGPVYSNWGSWTKAIV